MEIHPDIVGFCIACGGGALLVALYVASHCLYARITGKPNPLRPNIFLGD